jgi:hypothetical protein
MKYSVIRKEDVLETGEGIYRKITTWDIIDGYGRLMNYYPYPTKSQAQKGCDFFNLGSAN